MSYEEYFVVPRNATHRQYEALRAFFVESRPDHEVAKAFGYSLGSFRVLCSHFRTDPDRVFFVVSKPGPREAVKKDPVRDLVIELRKKNLSVYDIERALHSEGRALSSVAIGEILKEAGFSRLPRRKDEERPGGPVPVAADVADVSQFDLTPRKFRTQFGGLFLFLPLLVKLPLESILKKSRFPGSTAIPAVHAVRSLLALKLYGNARHSHIMSHVFDEGLALFAGLNVIPKRAFLTEYSTRVHPDSYPVLMKLWFEAASKLGLGRGVSFDLDFHSIPFHGDDPIIEKHYISKRSRSQKGVLAFLVRDADERSFCYANAEIRKGDQNDEVIRFIDFWFQRTGHYPDELVFDSKLTTYKNLALLDRLGIHFITLRRRSKELVQMVEDTPASAWRRIQLSGVSREYRTPRMLDQTVELADYPKPLRQIVLTDLGHEEPTFVITNQLRRSAPQLVTRYAQRMLIENSIADGVDFFHMDALSSSVPMKTNCDLQLTLLASTLYRLLGNKIGRGYEVAKARTIFRDFIQATATVTISESEVVVRLQKRAHNPLLLAAGYGDACPAVPWMGGKRLRFLLGEGVG
jgi:hypothetical protein